VGDAWVPQIAMSRDGTAIAVWQQFDGTRFNIWANRYTPPSGWGIAELLEANDTGRAEFPQVAMDSGGDATAVWQQFDGAQWSIYSNRFIVGSGWGAPELLEANDIVGAIEPHVAVTPAGNALAVWNQWDGIRTSVYANRYTPGIGWAGAELVEHEDRGDSLHPQVAVDNAGNALGVWSQLNGSRVDVMANRFVPGTGWGLPAVIETDNTGDASEARVAMNGNGIGLVVWQQSDGARVNILANRFSPRTGWGAATLVETDNSGDALNPDPAIDDGGDGMVVWHQFDGYRFNVWANSYRADRVPPVLIVTAPLGGTTNNPNVTVAGYTESDATAAVDGSPVPVLGDGSFSVNVRLSEGTHIFMITATDLEGNVNSVSATVRVDTSAPFLELSSPTDGSSTELPSVNVSGTTEAGARISVNGLLLEVRPDGRFSVIVGLEEGSNLVRVTSTDVAGNQAAAALRVTYTNLPPRLREDLNHTRDALNATREALSRVNADVTALIAVPLILSVVALGLTGMNTVGLFRYARRARTISKTEESRDEGPGKRLP